MKKGLPFLVLLWLLAALPAAAQQQATVRLIHLTDYHSHAVSFYNEGQADQAGIARVIAYLKPHAADPGTLILSGGDSMNLGSPAWSDKYRCVEWPWLNGILDAMAYGNHDSDYGPDVFAQCRTGISYPILSSNVLDAGVQPLFQTDGKSYRVFESNGVKIGVFALAGSDFERLIKPELRPAAGATFADRVQTARSVVDALRNEEQVNAVVLFGHALREDDIALAQAVPGIDLVLGTHSHRKEDLFQIPGTSTMMLSSFQYLTYLSNVQLHFVDGKLSGIDGGLVRMSSDLPQDPEIAQRVAQLQAELEADPAYAHLFERIGEAAVELSTDGQFTGEAVLGNFVLDIVREAAGSQMVVATSSSFREPIPPGPILESTLLTAMPYKNQILVYQLKGDVVQELLNYSVSRSGSDFFSQVAGVRFAIVEGKASAIKVLRDPANPAAGFAPLDAGATYSVATSDFQGKLAGGYKDIFAKALSVGDPQLEVRDQVHAYVRAHSPVSAARDGRMSDGSVITPSPTPNIPAQLPNTGPAPAPATAPWTALLALIALLGLAGGALLRRRA